MKKAISVLLCFVMVIGVFCSAPMTVFAFEEEEVLTFTEYTGDGGHYGVSCYVKDYKGEIVIPATYNGLPVTDIGYEAFKDCVNITSITIPETVDSILLDAFAGCESLEKIIVDENNQVYASVDGALYNKEMTRLLFVPSGISGTYITPESVEVFDADAFKESKITAITLNSKIDEIQKETYNKCKSLAQINVPVENPAFSSDGDVIFNKDKTLLIYCLPSKTGEYSIPETVTEIMDSAFNYSNLTSVVVGGNVKKIGASAFNSSNIYNITLTEGIEYIEGYAFAYCNNLTSLKIPSGVKKLPGALIHSCENIKEVEIGDNIGEISLAVLGSNVGELEKLSIGTNIEKIDESAFCYMDSIKELHIKALEDWISVDLTNYEDNGNIFKIAENIYVDGKDIREITELTLSKEHDFSKNTEVLKRCTSLEEFKIAENAETLNYTVKDGVLYDSNLTTILKYPTGKISEYVFPKTVTTIGNCAFEAASGLTGIEIPSRFSSLGKNMFKDCSGLKKVVLPEETTEIPEGAFINTGFTELVIPDTVTTIGENAFANCKNIKTLKMSKNIESVHSNAFKDALIEEYYISNEVVTRNSVLGVVASDIHFEEGVKVIKDGAFSSNKHIKTLYFADSIEEIGEQAFQYCDNLTSVNFGTGLLDVGNEAFEDCYSLNKVNLKNLHFWCNVRFGDTTANPLYYAKNLYLNDVLVEALEIPEGVIAVENFAFINAKSVKKLVIPDSVKAFGCSAFKGVNLEEVYIPDIEHWAQITIGDADSICIEQDVTKVFVDGSEITDVVIPESITRINDYSFKGWYFIKNITLNNVTEIGTGAFEGCTALVEVSFPKTVEYIAENAFDSCEALVKLNYPDVETFCKSEFMPGATETRKVYFNGELPEVIEIPETISELRPFAFMYFTSLKKVVLPKSIGVIGEYAFAFCSNLEEVVISGEISEVGLDAFIECNSLKSVSVENLDSFCWILFNSEKANPLYIAKNLYCNGELVTEVTFPEDLPEVIPYTFSGYDKLEKVTLSDSVKLVNDYSFADCTSLREVDFGDGVEEIGDFAFQNTALTKLEIPESIKKIANSSFFGCDSLTGIYITDLSKWCNVAFDYVSGLNISSNPLASAKNLYLNGELVEDLVIPQDVTKINCATFMGSSIKTVTIHDGVTHIQPAAFSGCSELEEVDMGESVTNISFYAFSGCQKLTSINIPDKVSYIGKNAFSGCSALEQVVLPESLTDIQEGAFAYCTKLKSAEINDGLKTLPKNLFQSCSELRSVKIPASVTKIDSTALPKNKNYTLIIYGVENSRAQIFANEKGFNFVDYKTLFAPAENVKINEGRYVSSLIAETDAGKIVNVPTGYIAKPVDPVAENLFIGTGSKIGIYDENDTLIDTIVVVVMGDLNGDGVCDVLDCMVAELARTSNVELKNEYLVAGDYTEDGGMDFTDLQQVVNKALNR